MTELKIKSDITVVLRINLNELIERLEERNYQKEKVKENIISESTDYCGIKAEESSKAVYEIEEEKDKDEMVKYIASIISGKPKKKPQKKEINKFDEMFELITTGNKYSL